MAPTSQHLCCCFSPGNSPWPCFRSYVFIKLFRQPARATGFGLDWTDCMYMLLLFHNHPVFTTRHSLARTKHSCINKKYTNSPIRVCVNASTKQTYLHKAKSTVARLFDGVCRSQWLKCYDFRKIRYPDPSWVKHYTHTNKPRSLTKTP